MAFSWRCPYCNQFSTIGEKNTTATTHSLYLDNADGYKIAVSRFIVCPNPDCQKFQYEVQLFDASYPESGGGLRITDQNNYKEWRLVPSSCAKVYPDYIPVAIRQDYEEACLIMDTSPKASATLSRRCLQGMIRDFWEVRKSRLVDEIDAIKDKVDPLTWEAIDAVRKIGNIGAHMERDINVIIDVDSEEAHLLIGLIETLIKDWYITRFERKKALEDIIAVRKAKDDMK